MSVDIYVGFMACGGGGSAWWGVRFKLVARAVLATAIPNSRAGAVVRESRTSATVVTGSGFREGLLGVGSGSGCGADRR